MKTNQVICGRNGNRLVTSTTETLRIKASEIEPGDWLLKPHGRVLRKDKLVASKKIGGALVYFGFQAGGSVAFVLNQMVDVERTR